MAKLRSFDLLMWLTEWEARTHFTALLLHKALLAAGIPKSEESINQSLARLAKAGLIRRLARGVFTTELGASAKLKFTQGEKRLLLKRLPDPFTVYDFREAYNKARGYTAFNHSVLSLWQRQGLIFKTDLHGWYTKQDKTKGKEV